MRNQIYIVLYHSFEHGKFGNELAQLNFSSQALQHSLF